MNHLPKTQDVPGTQQQKLPIRAIAPASENHTMELYAVGFNAWNQLLFEPSMIEDEPDDLFLFKKVLGAEEISRPRPRLCYTTVHRDGIRCLAGSCPGATISLENGENCIFDSLHAISGDGAVLTVAESKLQHGYGPQTLVRYPSVAAWKSGTDGRSWPCTYPVRQIEAYETGFVILCEDQDSPVSTMGDPRFADCLGRDVDESNPADEPCPVSLLSTLGDPIKKVTAGGFSLAALTEGGAVYIWGAESIGSHTRYQPFPDISNTPNYMEVDEEKDVMDVALGESHGIAITMDGDVYVVGSNTNGQLGFGKEFTGVATSWSKADFGVPPGWKSVGVEAGPKSSFILTAEKPKY